MIAACPKCHTRYRVQPQQLGADGARLRCSQCGAVFRVRLPESKLAAPAFAASAPEPVAAVRSAAPPEPRTSGVAAPSASAQIGVDPASREAARPAADSIPPASPPPAHEPRVERERLVVVANADPDACKRVAEALERHGLQVLVAHDGVEAILSIQRALPRAVVLDAALPKMFGFQVCELVKRNESLRSIGVVLVGAIHKEERYRRPPHDLYGADAYLEPRELPERLHEVLARLGLPVAGAPPALPEPVAGPSEEAFEPLAPASAPASGARDDGLAAERAKAERLARIIVSDIVLYNQARFDAALASGDVVGALRDELEEGRALFRGRVAPEVRGDRDFLAEELERVAAARRAR